MVDPERPRLREGSAHRVVDRRRRREVVAQRLLERQAGVLAREAARLQTRDRRLEQRRRGRQEDRQVLGLADRRPERVEALRLAGIERHITQPREELRDRLRTAPFGVDRRRQCVGRHGAKARVVELAARRRDDPQPVGQ